ncbi:MAG TPA: DUF3471 domain-containing protein, partial [Acetobacteraceae bacterium]|nr:DUF3471 domain-containing protein [Acetobacteraceae bacterium]
TGSAANEIVTNAVFDRLCGMEPADWLGRFRTRKHEFATHRGTDREARRGTRKSAAGPHRPLAEYAGDHDHPGYGRITITAGGDALHWRHRTLSGALSHRHYDVFEVPETDAPLAPSLMPVTFLYDREGDVDRLSAPFESQVPDIVFTRAPGGDVLDPAFRAAWAGVYRSGATTHVVTVDAEARVTLAPSGQPTYFLRPYRDRIFALEGLTGYRVEFMCDGDGPVERLIFHQPNGTFVAERVAE